jgi:hypothetical protein
MAMNMPSNGDHDGIKPGQESIKKNIRQVVVALLAVTRGLLDIRVPYDVEGISPLSPI